MTENNQNNVNQANQAQNVVYVKKRSVYAPFLLVMLILSSIFTAFSVLGVIVTVTGLASGFSNYSVTRIVAEGINLLVGLGSIAALALLWMRKKEGIILKFVLLALTIVGSILSIGFVRGDILDATRECRDLAAQQSSFSVRSGSSYDCEDERIAFNIFNELGDDLIIFGIILSVFWNGGIATLWYFAWRAQEKHDGIEKFLGKKASK